jgi:hypothetical protein
MGDNIHMGKRRKPPQKVPAKPQPEMSQPFWKRIPAWVYAAAAFVSIGITLAEGYPWLAIQEGALLNPSNPYSEMFSVTNGGYVPVTDLDASCIMNFESPHDIFSNSGSRFTNFAGYLAHGATATIPCFRTLNGYQVPSGARFDVIIGYAYYGLNYTRLRRHQSFHFQSVVGKDGSHHWIFLAP